MSSYYLEYTSSDNDDSWSKCSEETDEKEEEEEKEEEKSVPFETELLPINRS